MCAFLVCSCWLRAEPLKPEIAIQLPAGQKLAFCSIPLGIGDGTFAGLEFTVGGRGSGGFRENQMQVRISGAVILPDKGKPDWHILFGKHEITRAQWAVVMGEPTPPDSEANLPMVNISRAQIAIFLEKANKWLHQDKSASGLAAAFPAATMVFLRLPDEAEWEFAARGGRLTMADGRFDKRTSYSDALNLHEWYAGPDSSNGRLRPVGKLAPNPLGVHDMLGNASEITEGIYRVEYVQGRSGGVVMRGGNFRTSEKELRSSHRTEVPMCMENGDAYRSDSSGFRLVLGSPVMTSETNFSLLEKDWGEYSKIRVIPQPSLPANASLAQQTAAESAQISKLLDELTAAFALSQTSGETIEAKISQIRPQITSIQARIEDGQRYFAKAAVRLASAASMQSLISIRKLKVYTGLRTQQYQKPVEKLQKTLEQMKETLRDSCEISARIDANILAAEFDAHISSQESDADPDLKEQAECTRIAKVLLTDYVNHRRLDLDHWQASLEKLPPL